MVPLSVASFPTGLLLLGLPISLALDFGLLLLTGRVDIALGPLLSSLRNTLELCPLLSSLWSKYGTPVGCTLYIIVCLFSRRVETLMGKIWALLFLVRLLPFQPLKQAVEAESFRWSTDTVFYSRLLVLAIPLLEVGWLVVKKLGPLVLCALTTGALFRYFRETIYGRSSNQSMLASERGLGRVAPFMTFLWTGVVLNLFIVMVFYLCRFVGLLVGRTAWEVSLHVIAITCIGMLHTLWLRQFSLGEVTHRWLKLELPLSLTVRYALWYGAFAWFALVLVWLLWQGSLLPGEALLSGMTGLSKMQTYVHRLVLWITFGPLLAVFLKSWVAGGELHRRLTEQEKNMGWADLSIGNTLVGAWIYCHIVATITVGKILWDCVSTGVWMTAFKKHEFDLNLLLNLIKAGPY